MSLTAFCFGEVLWDVFPTEKKIGGAPLNVAVKLNALTIKTTLLTAVGNDTNSRGIQDFFEQQKLTDQGIQTNKHPTGIVTVNLDENKNADYTIEFPAAWDFITINEKLIPEVENTAYFIYGSLAARNSISKKTLFNYLQKTKAIKVLDLNLRMQFYSDDLIKELIENCNFLKINDEELNVVSKTYTINNLEIHEKIKALAKQTNLETICVTLGSEGAILFHNNQLFEQKAYKTKVIDTVGAGDAFLAMLLFMLKKTEPSKALKYACGAGAYVAGKQGANPEFSKEIITNFITE